MTGVCKSTMHESMYFLLKQMVIFQPVILVFRGIFPCKSFTKMVFKTLDFREAADFPMGCATAGNPELREASNEMGEFNHV